ncbi:rhodanese-like domain-containing protein [Pseudodesulfovibrio indicus]|jgi:rhodanese-related sulfurtransferase|uniref:Rhodanese-related sulfurtransferase n=1 Tax=Pseudodesulfovibrio indicus TaxID=1716143 RepID=A0A126QMY7_9BACT|nr:rhodanese-like domain-containing protein [Pseudodesulfovibrio indicus]AMK11177.1 hypothetical protein AWY79_08635 [Pseudodesulfovibrio indicus]TDT92197.1 rhodanese-related sulfurtransferase [Pseudodesulfovibrio indicus]
MNRKTAVFGLVLACLGMVFYLFLTAEPQPEGFEPLTAVQAQAQMAVAPDAVILDIRTPAEFAAGHIEGAVNIDYYAPDFESRLAALDRNVEYFVYCRSGNRSGRAMDVFSRLGFTRVKHLRNGIIDWEGAGLPLVR